MEDKKIVIYTSTTCPYCDMAKDYFRTKGIKYQEMSTAEPENRKKLVSMGIRGVPAIFIGNKHFVGFDPVEIEKLLAEPDQRAEPIVEQEIVPEDVPAVEPLAEPAAEPAEKTPVEVPVDANAVENVQPQGVEANAKPVMAADNKGGNNMTKYICQVCGYVYDPAVGDEDNGIAPGTTFEQLPEDWVCPLCGVGKDQFEAE